MPHDYTNNSSSTTPLSVEELDALRNLLHTQQSLKRKSREEDLTPDIYRTREHIATEDDIGNGHSDDYDSNTPWIGVKIKAPAGERGRGTNAEGRLGFRIEDILKHARITTVQWSNFMSTAHRLINYHFDITKNWTTNTSNNPNAWRLIVSEMQELHPRFLFHEGNWLIKHLTISHLANMNRKFRRMEPDPDRADYQAYLANRATPRFPTSIQGPTSNSLYNEAAASSPLASKKTNTSGCILPSSNNATTSSRVPPVPAITARPEQVRAVELSSDLETETDFTASDLCDDQHPKKKQKHSTQTEVPAHQPPVHQSRSQSQRTPLLPLNSPARAPTAMTRNVPNRTHLKQGTRGSRAKGKARKLSPGSDSDEGRPPPRPQRQCRRGNNPRDPHITSPM